MDNRKFWTYFFLIATLLTAVLIFCFSAQQGVDSSALSNGVTKTVARVVNPDYVQLPPKAQQSYLKSLSLLIRKNAHFCEFALLGFNLMSFLRLKRRERRFLSSGLTAWGIATLYAGTDELHQLFVSERSAALLDVGIDSTGSLTGILVAALCLVLLARLRQRRAKTTFSSPS